MWIGSKHRVRWLTAGDSMKKTRGGESCDISALSGRASLAHCRKKRPPPHPAADHTHGHSHSIPKYACMTSMQLPRTSHSAGHSAGRGRHTLALYKERCMSLHQHAYMHKSFPISRTPRCGQIRGAGKMRYAQRWYTRACVWRKGGDGLGLHIDTIT